MWLVLGISIGHGPVSKLRLLTVFPPVQLFLYLRLPRDSLPCEGSTAFCTGTTTCEGYQSTTSASLPLFPDLRIVFQPPTIVMWKHMCSYTCGPQSQRLASPARSHESNSLCQENCSVKPSPFHPDAEAVTVLAHIFAQIEGLTNTRQRTHRKPPLSSSTPSQDPATCSTSFTSPSRLRSSPLHVHTTVRTLATPLLHCDFTSWEDALGLHTETPHNAPIWGTECPASHARTTNPAAQGCGEARRHLPEMSRSSSDQLA